MGEIKDAITILAVVALLLMMILAFCRFLGLWTWTAAWIFSSKEEKIGLTRSSGHYNANGYLISSESDIHLDSTGTFQRFDVVDRDFRVPITTSSLMSVPPVSSPPPIPPQPLRPAPAPYLPPLSPTPSTSRQDSNCAPSPVKQVLIPLQRLRPSEVVSTPALDGEPEELEDVPAYLPRGVSCESMCSDTSVMMGDIADPNVTGSLCVGLEYDSENADLVVSVLEAKDLVSPDNSDTMDSFVKVYLLPDKNAHMSTRIVRKTNCPSYKEKFLITLEQSEFLRRSLIFYVFSSDNKSQTLIGEAELRLCDVTGRQPVTTWLTLTDSDQRVSEYGELMFSLSYLPTAARLTVVVVKARNLQFQPEYDPGDPFVKVYVLQHGKKIFKKKTTIKRGESHPIFNEAMMFNVPSHTLKTIQVRVTAAQNISDSKAYAIGHVIVGTQATGKALSHWNQMLISLRKPVAVWHTLRK